MHIDRLVTSSERVVMWPIVDRITHACENITFPLKNPIEIFQNGNIQSVKYVLTSEVTMSILETSVGGGVSSLSLSSILVAATKIIASPY